MDKREFWSTKNPGPQYRTVAFSHASFSATFRLVADVFASVTLGGDVYTPAPMRLKTPDQRGDAQPKLTISFPRQVVGRQFKQQLALVRASGSRVPIVVTYGLWLGEIDAPKVTWSAYIADKGGVSFNGDLVQVSATIDDPMRQSVAAIYLPETFTGLEAL